MKKVISFSLYGDQYCYFQGAIDNLKMKNEFYPDWIYRFYVDGSINQDYINKLLEIDDSIEIIKKPNSQGHLPMFWRISTLDDKDIDCFIVRDTDSRPTLREVISVTEWLESTFSFHIIRDNKSHGVPILGGMWGAKSSFKPGFENLFNDWKVRYKDAIENSTTNRRGKYFGMDQHFLRTYIWPLVKEDHLAHIANFENLKFTGNEVILSNENVNFIGRSFLKNLNKKYE